MNKKGRPLHGWIALDKPLEMTSTQALGAVKRLLKPKKAGHAGTLDPLATGILPVALGDATKLVNFAQEAIKVYDFTIQWGERRETDDAEGEVIATSDHRPKIEEIAPALEAFIGEIEQIPPKYSAIKINGQRAYDLARDGMDVEIKSRIVYIERLNILEATTDTLRLKCVCGKGTYVRALARDIAHALGTEGYVSALRRTQVGAFTEENAISLDDLENFDHNTSFETLLQPLEMALDDIPVLSLTQEEAARLKNGNVLTFVARPDFQRLLEAGIDTENGDQAAAFFQGKLIALVGVTGPRIQPERVFNT